MSRYEYLEVFQRAPWNSRGQESTVFIRLSGPELFLSVSRLAGAQLVVFFRSSIPVVLASCKSALNAPPPTPLALRSPSSIAAHFAFCFTSCVVMLAFWSPSTAAHFAFCFTSSD